MEISSYLGSLLSPVLNQTLIHHALAHFTKCVIDRSVSNAEDILRPLVVCMNLASPVASNLCSIGSEKSNELDEAVFGFSRRDRVAHRSEMIMQCLTDFAHPNGLVSK